MFPVFDISGSAYDRGHAYGAAARPHQTGLVVVAHGLHRQPGAGRCIADGEPAAAHTTAAHSRTARSLSALPITETDDRLMAAAAIIGLSSRPNTG